MALPRRQSYGGGGGLNIGGLLSALYDMGVFGETEESKRAKELEMLQQKGPQALQASAQAFAKGKTAEEQQGLYNAFQAMQGGQDFNPGFLTTPKTRLPNFPSTLSPEAIGEALKSFYGSNAQALGFNRAIPESNLAAEQAGLGSELLNLTRPQTLTTGTSEANRRLGESTLANEQVNDPEYRKNKLLSGRFSALNEGALKIPEGSALISAGGTTQYTSPTQHVETQYYTDPKTGQQFPIGQKVLSKPGELIVGRIPLPGSVNPYAESSVKPAGIPSNAHVLPQKTYTIPKKSTDLTVPQVQPQSAQDLISKYSAGPLIKPGARGTVPDTSEAAVVKALMSILNKFPSGSKGQRPSVGKNLDEDLARIRELLSSYYE